MTETRKTPANRQTLQDVYFNDGCVKGAQQIYIAAKLKGLDPEKYDFSKCYIYKEGKWGRRDFEWNVASVCYAPQLEYFFTLSVQGDIEIAAKEKGFIKEKIPEAGTYDGIGSVHQIRAIGDNIYVCGSQGQVYKRTTTGWQHMDDGLLDRKPSASALYFSSIGGENDSSIYVVGFGGKIFHFNGQRWNEVPSSTNQNLERVCATLHKEIYICGKNGTLLRGNDSGFQEIGGGQIKDHIWGLEYFRGQIYLATLKGLWSYNPDSGLISPVKTGLQPEIKGYRLESRGDVLWSFGVDDLAWFDGNTWTRLKHPNNG